MQTAAPGTAAGKAIGTTISTAISTALPAIGTIIHAIWPTNPNQNKKQPDAIAATANLQEQSTQALAQIAKESADLSVITIFLSNCVVAENNVVSMRTYLHRKTSLDANDKLELEHFWNVAKGRIQNLKSAGSSIDALDDPAVATTLRAISDANAGLVDNVTSELGAGSTDLLNADLATLDSQLSAVNALSGEIIAEISVALKAVQTKAAGAQSPQVPPIEAIVEARTAPEFIQTKAAGAESLPVLSEEFERARADLQHVLTQRIRGGRR
jgi:hypothetical protein